MTLRGRLIALVLCASLPAILIAGAVLTLLQREMTGDVHQQAAQKAELSAARVESLLMVAHRLLRVMTIDHAPGAEHAECQALAVRQLRSQQEIAGFALIASNGAATCVFPAGIIPDHEAARSAIREGLRADRPYLSALMPGATPVERVFLLFHPALPSAASPSHSGLAVAVIRGDALIEKAIGPRTDADPLYLQDRNKTLLPAPGTDQNPQSQDFVERLLVSESASAVTDDTDGVARAYVGLPVPLDGQASGLSVVRGVAGNDIQVLLQHYLWITVGVIAVILLAMFLLARLFVSKMLQPRIHALLTAARRFAAGDFEHRIAEVSGRHDELAELELAFNEMRDHIVAHDSSLVRLSERFRSVADATNDWIFDWDIETNEVWGNAGFTQHATDNRLGEIPQPGGKHKYHWAEFVYSEDAPAFAAALRSAFRSETQQWVHTCRLTRAGSEPVTVRLRSHLYRNAAGRVIRIVGGVTDISPQIEMETELRRRETNLRTAEELGGMGSWHWDVRTHRNTWSDGVFKLFGLDPEQPAPDPEALAKLIAPHSYSRAKKAMELVFSRNAPYQVEIEIIRADGQRRWLMIRADVDRDSSGTTVALVGTAQDITQQRQNDEQLRLLRRVVESAASGIVVADALQDDLPLVYVNPAFEAMTGYRAGEVLGRNCRFLNSSDTGQPALNEVRAALREQRETRVVLRNYRKDGQLFLNQFLLSPVRDNHGRVTHYVGIQEDVTEREMSRKRTAEHAMIDPLTSLPNRNLLADRVSQSIAISAAAQQRFYFALFNIDRFKVINESLGHVGGDEVLRRIAERLGRMIGAADTVARFGGDVFALVISHTSIAKNGFDLDLFDAPLRVDGKDIFVTASIGIAEYPTHGADFETLFRHAEIAMYHAKANGGNRVEFFRPELDAGASHRLNLEHEIREALAGNQFRLAYQPQIDATTGRICGVEALIRWVHPTRGVLPPAAFIPMAEESGLIVDMGNWVLEEAARQRAAWRAMGVEDDVVICVNASPLQFRRGTVLPTLLRLKREYGFESGFLELEVTESMLMDGAERMIDDLVAIRQLGVKLSIDDFGTGYSSLAYLKRLPIDMIKIDKAFVKDVMSDPNDAVICTTIIALAHNLGVRVCAEGVEGAAQSEFLRQHDCDVLQGYYFSEPVLADVVTEMFATQRVFLRGEP